jgi:hypothetical protein
VKPAKDLDPAPREAYLLEGLSECRLLKAFALLAHAAWKRNLAFVRAYRCRSSRQEEMRLALSQENRQQNCSFSRETGIQTPPLQMSQFIPDSFFEFRGRT